MYYIKLISLKGCPYSEAAESLLSNNKIKSEIVSVNYHEKDKFKTNEAQTFPQLYLKKKYSSGSLFLGGYDTFKSYYDLAHSNSNKENILDKIKQEIKNKNKNMSNKSILRLIELLI